MASGSRPTSPRQAVDEIAAVAEPTPVPTGPPISQGPVSALLPQPSLSPDGSGGGEEVQDEVQDDGEEVQGEVQKDVPAPPLSPQEAETPLRIYKISLTAQR